MAVDLERLDQLLDDQELAVRRAFRDFVAVFGDGPVWDEIMRHLENRDVEGAVQIVDTYLARFATVVNEITLDVGNFTAAELQEIIPSSVIAIAFNPSHARAAELVASNAARLVREMSWQQRRAIQQALNRSFAIGEGTAAMARAFRNAIGLTADQEQAVANYRRLLENRDRAALQRALRDRRFDSTVERAISRNRNLTARQLDRMVERYRARSLIARSETIARTESITATSIAREEAAEQMIEQTGIDRRRVIRIWRTTRDKRRRDWHGTMEMQRRAIGELFTDGLGQRLQFPGDPDAPANTRINCRCTIVFEITPSPT